MMKNTNKIEVLRALCYDVEDLSTIANLPYDFSQSEIDCVVEFKKIYEEGLGKSGQFGLKRFINRLLKEGHAGTIDSYTINYFVKELMNGPFKNFVSQFTKGKFFFRQSPDTMGCLGEDVRAASNVSICSSDSAYPLGTFPTVTNKLPEFMTDVLKRSVQVTEDLFRKSMTGIWSEDNTLPLVDKKPSERTDSEPVGNYDAKPIGNYGIKDVTDYVNMLNPMSSVIRGNVKSVLKENTDYEKRYLYKKMTNGFSNPSKTENYKLRKTWVDGEKSEEIVQDLMGEEFESDIKRASELDVDAGSTIKKYMLNTNEGQLGNGTAI